MEKIDKYEVFDMPVPLWQFIKKVFISPKQKYLNEKNTVYYIESVKSIESIEKKEKENRIYIEFNENLPVLVGEEFGKEVYKNQIEHNFKYNSKNIIVFPDQIKKISISFIEGMFKEILKKIDKKNIERFINIESKSEELKKKIMSNIKF